MLGLGRMDEWMRRRRSNCCPGAVALDWYGWHSQLSPFIHRPRFAFNWS